MRKRGWIFKAARRVPVRPRAVAILIFLAFFCWVPLAAVLPGVLSRFWRDLADEVSEIYRDCWRTVTDVINALKTGENQ